MPRRKRITKPRPRKPFRFTRVGDDGQIVYLYRDERGKEHSRRVPKHITAMQDAQAWVLEHVYGVKPERASQWPEVPDKVLKLRALANGTDNPNEAANARRLLERMGYEV